MAVRRDRIVLLQHRPVLADQRAILQLGFDLRGVGIEVQHQRSVMKACATSDDLVVSVEQPTLKVRSIASKLEPERNVLAVKSDGGVPETCQRRRRVGLSKGGGRDCEEESS